jgi:hypothetical protein
MSKEMNSRSLSICVGIVVLLTSCSPVAASPSMPLDIRAVIRGLHLGVTMRNFTIANAMELVVGGLNG